MMKPTTSLLLIGLVLTCVDHSVAFSVAPAGCCAQRLSSSPPTSTCLFSEEEGAGGEEAPQDEAPAADADASTDILNSPAFLKRKIDVLKSDIAKAEEDIELAKQRLEEGKAEWGAQLDELQKEVSSTYTAVCSRHRPCCMLFQ